MMSSAFDDSSYMVSLQMKDIEIHFTYSPKKSDPLSDCKIMVPLVTQIVSAPVPSQLQLMIFFVMVKHDHSKTSDHHIMGCTCLQSQDFLKMTCQLILLDIGDPPFMKESFSKDFFYLLTFSCFLSWTKSIVPKFQTKFLCKMVYCVRAQ